jgi:hypothetical protein
VAGDLYMRVYHLPERLHTARAKVAKIKRAIAFLGDDTRASDRKALEAAERRLRSLENEARQFNFHDLIDTPNDDG